MTESSVSTFGRVFDRAIAIVILSLGAVLSGAVIFVGA